LADGNDRGAHGGAGGKAVVHQNENALPQIGGMADAEGAFALLQFELLAGDGGVNDVLGDAKGMDDVVVKEADAAGGDGAHGEFLVAGHAQFADDEDIERRMEAARDFEGDRDAAAGKAEHDEVGSVGEAGEFIRQHLARLRAILETKAHARSLSPKCRDASGDGRAQVQGFHRRWNKEVEAGAICCNWLQLAATGCNWLQLAATGCNWLQLAATGCNWLQVSAN
jgi:hypothetical protein